jgi:hypothetical protein
MSHRFHMCSLAARILLLCATLSACVTSGHEQEHGEPGLPRALGTIAVSAGLDAAAWTMLELRFAPVASDGAFESFARSVELATNTLPFNYSIGGDLGINQWPAWRLTAWLTNAGNSPDDPSAGEPAAAVDLTFSCTNGCPVQSGIDLLLH